MRGIKKGKEGEKRKVEQKGNTRSREKRLIRGEEKGKERR